MTTDKQTAQLTTSQLMRDIEQLTRDLERASALIGLADYMVNSEDELQVLHYEARIGDIRQTLAAVARQAISSVANI